MDASRAPESVCCITGFSQHTLKKVFDELSVDRIDVSVGYVEGNCQLMAYSLNRAKGIHERVPSGAIIKLIRKVQRTVRSKHDESPVQD